MKTERILQFGTGRLLRGLVDLPIHTANSQGQDVGQVVVVQSTQGNRAELINQQGGVFHILIQGVQNGELVDKVEKVESISRALVADTQWSEVIEVARSPELKFVVSNTTEKGFEVAEQDDVIGSEDLAPASYPAKLLAVLRARFEADRPGVTVLPCELIEHNAGSLKRTILELAVRQNSEPGLTTWISNECRFRSTLVDRIVPGKPKNHPLLETDPLVEMAEPFAMWAIEHHEGDPKLCEHPALIYTNDLNPYFLRKVRILNGAHTALVSKWIANGKGPYSLVREAMEDQETKNWLQKLVNEEIVPVIEARVDDAPSFASATFDRFANPYIDHKLEDISLYHETKVGVRLVPTLNDFKEKFGKEPPLLAEVLKPYL